jgi:hypothetical protein
VHLQLFLLQDRTTHRCRVGVARGLEERDLGGEEERRRMGGKGWEAIGPEGDGREGEGGKMRERKVTCCRK